MTELEKKQDLLKKIVRRELALYHSETGEPQRYNWYDVSVYCEVGVAIYQVMYTTSIRMIIADIKALGGELPTT